MLICLASVEHQLRQIIYSNRKTAIIQATANHHFGLPLTI